MWNALWPLLIYMAAQGVVTVAGSLVLMIVCSFRYADEAGRIAVDAATEGALQMLDQYALIFVLIAALVCILIYGHIYRKDFEKLGRIRRNIPMDGKDYAALIICGATLAIALNNLISITPIPQIFTGYEDTNDVIYESSIVVQILTAGIFGCLTEEISHRGITYVRMRHYWGKRKAIFWSALVFGIYHMNMVQAVYAFFLGLFFAWVYERYDSLWASTIAHMSANLCVLLLGDVTNRISDSMVGYCLLTCICLLLFYYGWRFMKQTNPLVELEFVKKEPDSLETLTKEYQEQGRKDE